MKNGTKFRIGDRVRIKRATLYTIYVGEEGYIINTSYGNSAYPYRVKLDNTPQHFGFSINELELISIETDQYEEWEG